MATAPDNELEQDSALEGGEQEFSLADLANLDASEIAEVRFESLPAGLYVFRGESAVLEDTQNRDDERRIVLIQKMEVTEVKSVLERMSPEDKEALVGKKHTEKFYIVPAKAAEGIGLIRAHYADIGLPNGGAMGGVEGQEPGFIDGFVGHEFPGKIIKQGRKGDPTTKDSRLRIEAAKKRA